MEALAETLDLKLIIKGPRPDLSRASWLLSQTRFALSNLKAAMSLLVSSISWMAVATLLGSVQIVVGALWATTAYVRCGMVAAGSMSFSQSSMWTRALLASSLVLKERMTFLLGSLEVLGSADGMCFVCVCVHGLPSCVPKFCSKRKCAAKKFWLHKMLCC